MTWTQEHSRNAVAKRARNRIAKAVVPMPERKTRVHVPRTSPDFTINIRSRSGARVQITATRYGNQIITSEGVTSLRALTRGIEVMLRECTP